MTLVGLLWALGVLGFTRRLVVAWRYPGSGGDFHAVWVAVVAFL